MCIYINVYIFNKEKISNKSRNEFNFSKSINRVSKTDLYF